jgi:hypothetical protein
MQAIIPTRRHAKPWKDQRLGATVRNAFLRPRTGLGGNLEEVERLSPAQPYRGQDAMFQTPL